MSKTVKIEPRTENIAKYEGFLKGQGLSDETISRYVSYVKHCVKILGYDVEPQYAGRGEVEMLEQSFEGLSKITAQRYMLAWDLYVRSAKAAPYPDDRTPYYPSERYDRDIKRFMETLLCRGMSERSTEVYRRYVTNCWKILNEHVGYLEPHEVDDYAMWIIERQKLNQTYGNRSINIRSFGKFIHFTTGYDPYREARLPASKRDRNVDLTVVHEDEPFSRELGDYVIELNSRGIKDSTIFNYLTAIRRCIEVLQDWYPEFKLEWVDYNHVRFLRDYFSNLRISTNQAYINRFGDFIKFVHGFDPVACLELKWKKQQNFDRVFITIEQWVTLWENADVEERLILALGGSMGLRRVEMTRIKLGDFRDGKLYIRGKGNNEKGDAEGETVTELVQEALDKYMPFRQSILDKYGDLSEGHLLVCRHYHAGERMTPDNVGDIIYRMSKRTGIRVTPHSLRRLYAMALNDSDMSLETIRQMMRHAQVETTLKCYIDADPRKKQQAVMAINDTFKRAMSS